MRSPAFCVAAMLATTGTEPMISQADLGDQTDRHGDVASRPRVRLALTAGMAALLLSGEVARPQRPSSSSEGRWCMEGAPVT